MAFGDPVTSSKLESGWTAKIERLAAPELALTASVPFGLKLASDGVL